MLAFSETTEDRVKFEKLYTQYRRVMHHVAYDILQNEADAEDVVHQAFLKIADRISLIDDSNKSKTKGYLVTIVENKAIDLLRYNQRHSTVELDSVEISVSIEYDKQNLIKMCLTKLPNKQRDVLLLRYLHGFSNQETAWIMGLTESNVIKINQRAKKRLRNLCEEEIW